MIEGQVNSNLELVIPIGLYARNGAMVTLVAVIDTAFDGYLKLSPEALHELGLERISFAEFGMADDRVVRIPIYGGLLE